VGIIGIGLATQFVIIEHVFSWMPNQSVHGTNILVFGIDSNHYSQRSDSIMLVHVDPIRKRTGVISIPRDTRVQIPTVGISKINHAYARGGTALLKKTLSNFLNIPIHHHIQVDSTQLAELIDRIGGIEITVANDLSYSDLAGELDISITQGNQVLMGHDAVSYLRFRQDAKGDIGRIERQQTFVRAAIRQFLKPAQLLRVPSLISQLGDAVSTDLPLSSMTRLAMHFLTVAKTKSIETAVMPGAVVLVDGISYWRPDFAAIDHMIEQTLFGFKDSDLNVAAIPNRRTLTVKEMSRVYQNQIVNDTDALNPKGLANLRIEILNGNGLAGSAAAISNRLNAYRVYVASMDNAAHFNYPATLLVDWKGNLNKAMALATALNISADNIIVYDRPNKPLDFTVVIGHDQGFYTQ
tara:strand:+ start:274 stop:1503 length:1230 start_codon:yes stop_codon:yes gene_type:complete